MTTFFACEPFVDVDDVLAREGCTLDTGEDGVTELILNAIDAASDMLYVLSGGKVAGECTKTFRPFRDGNGACWPAPGYSSPWYSSGEVDGIPLTKHLISVEAVIVDGTTLGINDYGLIDNHILFRRDADYWPSSNDLKLDDTKEGTWSIRIKFGPLPDWLAKQATVDMVLALTDDYGNGRGYLRNARSAQVQGVSVQLESEAGLMVQRGLPMLERFLGTYAPGGSEAVGVWAPELDSGWTLVEVEGPSGS